MPDIKKIAAPVMTLAMMSGLLVTVTACDFPATDDLCDSAYVIPAHAMPVSVPMRGGSGSSGYSGGGSRSGGYSSGRSGGGYRSSYSSSYPNRVSYGGRSYYSKYPSSYLRRTTGGVTYVFVNNAWVVDDGGC